MNNNLNNLFTSGLFSQTPQKDNTNTAQQGFNTTQQGFSTTQQGFNTTQPGFNTNQQGFNANTTQSGFNNIFNNTAQSTTVPLGTAENKSWADLFNASNSGVASNMSTKRGTKDKPFEVSKIRETGGYGCLEYQHINMMKEYSDKSCDELRWEDYNLGRKPASMNQNYGTMNTMVGNTTNTSFGSTTPFGGNQQNTVTSQAPSGIFGSGTSLFANTSLPNNANTGGLTFGAANNTNPFSNTPSNNQNPSSANPFMNTANNTTNMNQASNTNNPFLNVSNSTTNNVTNPFVSAMNNQNTNTANQNTTNPFVNAMNNQNTNTTNQNTTNPFLNAMNNQNSNTTNQNVTNPFVNAMSGQNNTNMNSFVNNTAQTAGQSLFSGINNQNTTMNAPDNTMFGNAQNSMYTNGNMSGNMSQFQNQYMANTNIDYSDPYCTKSIKFHVEDEEETPYAKYLVEPVSVEVKPMKREVLQYRKPVVEVKEDFYFSPPLEDLRGLKIVNNVSIIFPGKGSIYYYEPVDVSALTTENVNKKILFLSDTVMINDPPGKGLNLRARVCIEKVFPFSKSEKCVIVGDTDKYPQKGIQDRFIYGLKHDETKKFVDYEISKGLYVYEVNHF